MLPANAITCDTPRLGQSPIPGQPQGRVLEKWLSGSGLLPWDGMGWGSCQQHILQKSQRQVEKQRAQRDGAKGAPDRLHTAASTCREPVQHPQPQDSGSPLLHRAKPTALKHPAKCIPQPCPDHRTHSYGPAQPCLSPSAPPQQLPQHPGHLVTLLQ